LHRRGSLLVHKQKQPLSTRNPAGHHPTAVALSGVTRVFGAVPALVRVDLEVASGETVLIRGPNGAGKTTLLRLIATLLSPTYGTGSVLGFDLTAGRDEIRRRTELLGHHTRLYDDLSARENLAFTCAAGGTRSDGIPAALERVGLTWAADEPVGNYSQGMRQRVAVARTLLRSPDLLLLDEPFAGLDADAKGVVEATILEAKRERRTVVLATHDSGVERMASRIVYMDGGRLVSGVSTEAHA
jgi:heme exporter protein A